jgi:hypothetical protein
MQPQDYPREGIQSSEKKGKKKFLMNLCLSSLTLSSKIEKNA